MPLAACRAVSVRGRKTCKDYAGFLRALAEGRFPAAEKIVLAQDNLNTHSAVSLYKAFDPATAPRLLESFEFQYTPRVWQLARRRGD